MKFLKDFAVVGKRVLVRCDFNVPLDKKGNISDDFRIKATLPTIQYLIDSNAKVILMSHLDPESTGVADKKYKFDQVAEKLSELLGFSVGKGDDCIGPEIESAVNNLEEGGVLLLENLRFYKEETENNLEFAKKLSYLGDIYVNDAFGVCHRNHASVVGVAQLLPNCAGLLLEKEIETLTKVMKNPDRPMLAIIGGIKIETKVKFIDNISKVADYVIVSGLIAKGAKEKNINFSTLGGPALGGKFSEEILAPLGKLDAPDINSESIKMFCEKIMQAKTILWNGPFGRTEDKKYVKGTLAIANAIIESKAFSVAGGGETVEFINKQGILDKFSHVSTGGGAMLGYLSGDELPGLAVLK